LLDLPTKLITQLLCKTTLFCKNNAKTKIGIYGLFINRINEKKISGFGDLNNLKYFFGDFQYLEFIDKYSIKILLKVGVNIMICDNMYIKILELFLL
jgi:hypothetical protein